MPAMTRSGEGGGTVTGKGTDKGAGEMGNGHGIETGKAGKSGGGKEAKGGGKGKRRPLVGSDKTH